MPNTLDPDQTRLNVGSDLDPNSLQKVSADDNNRHGKGLIKKQSDKTISNIRMKSDNAINQEEKE